MSEHLSTLDAGFLEADDSDRHVSLAVGGISVIEGPLPIRYKFGVTLNDVALTVITESYRSAVRTLTRSIEQGGGTASSVGGTVRLVS
jgi:diacylglycerol O-acyltransferase